MDRALPRRFYFVIDGGTLGTIEKQLWEEVLAVKGIYGKDLGIQVTGPLSAKARDRVRELETFGKNVFTAEHAFRLPPNAKAVYFTNDESLFTERREVFREIEMADFLRAVQWAVSEKLREALPDRFDIRRFINERFHFDAAREIGILFDAFVVITRAA